jgi:hypothetical protein
MSMEIANDSHDTAGSPRKPPRKRAADSAVYGRTKIQNGSAVIAGVNQSRGYVRRLKELLARYQGEMPNASPADRSLIQRACILEIELERLETKMAGAGETSQRNLDLYVRTTGNLRRALRDLGLQHRDEKPNGRNPDSPLGRILREGLEREQTKVSNED